MKRTFQVTGLQFHSYKELQAKLVPGVQLSLERDPKNQYDINAIRVNYEGKQVGWIPKIVNGELALLMDEGKTPTATITSNETKFSSRNPAGLYIEVAV